MGWRCFLLEGPPCHGTPDYRPGGMWLGDYDPRLPKDDKKNEDARWWFVPTQEFLASTRKVYWIALPGPKWDAKNTETGLVEPHFTLQYFCLEQRASSVPEGWTWSGEPPNITISPSINCEGRYHGYVQNGIVTHCLDGRLFPHYPENA